MPRLQQFFHVLGRQDHINCAHQQMDLSYLEGKKGGRRKKEDRLSRGCAPSDVSRFMRSIQLWRRR